MKKEQSREESIKAILKAALSLFTLKGFKATTTDEIAAKAKVSKGLIYFYFSSKEEILVQLIEDAFKEFEGDIPEGLEPLEVIHLFAESCKASLKNQEKWKLLISILFQNQKNASVTNVLKDKYAFYTQQLSRQFENLGSENAMEEAHHFIAAMDGLALQSVFAADLIEADKVIDHILSQINKKYQP